MNRLANNDLFGSFWSENIYFRCVIPEENIFLCKRAIHGRLLPPRKIQDTLRVSSLIFLKKEARLYLTIYISYARLYFRLNLISLLAGPWRDGQKTAGSMRFKTKNHTKSVIVFV